MAGNIIALALTAIISIFLPIVLYIILMVTKPMERKHISILYVGGVLIYFIMQWGVKEHGLSYLFNHTNFAQFMNNHYIPYLLLIAFVGALLTLVPIIVIVQVFYKKQFSFAKAIALSIGYGMAEAVMLVGYRSIVTIYQVIINSEAEIDATTVELFLSAYERILMMIIQIAIVVTLVYFIEIKMSVRGGIIAIIWQTLASFLPGFFIAFSLKNYYEVYDRSLALGLVYIVLTVTAICSAIVLKSLTYSLTDNKIDTPQAINAYRKLAEEKRQIKEQKRNEKQNKQQKNL